MPRLLCYPEPYKVPYSPSFAQKGGKPALQRFSSYALLPHSPMLISFHCLCVHYYTRIIRAPYVHVTITSLCCSLLQPCILIGEVCTTANWLKHKATAGSYNLATMTSLFQLHLSCSLTLRQASKNRTN